LKIFYSLVSRSRKYIQTLHLRRTKNKLLILTVNRHDVRKGQKNASDKSAFLCTFAIITINKQLTTALNTARADAHTASTNPQRIYNALISTLVTTCFHGK